MQMQTQLELLQLRLEGEVAEWVNDGCDVLSVREKVRDTIMPDYPQFYSWINKTSEGKGKIEVIQKSDGASMIELLFPLSTTENRSW